MRLLSATGAINPAIDRTKSLLFAPFRIGRSWKLAATAYLSLMGLVFIPYPLALLAIPSFYAAHDRVYLRVFLAVVFATTALFFVIFYLGSRLQFVVFGMVLEHAQTIAPLWRRYRSGVWGWIALKTVVSLAICLLFALPLRSRIATLIAIFPTDPNQPPAPALMLQIFSVYALILIPMALLALLSSLLGDFVLPSIALERTPVLESLRRFFLLARAEPGEMLLFLLMKVVLAIAALMAMQVAVLVVEIVGLIVFGLIGLIGVLVFHLLHIVSRAPAVAGGIALALLFFAFLIWILAGVQGTLEIFLQAYTLYFLGGRYPLLGSMLEPPPPRSPAFQMLGLRTLPRHICHSSSCSCTLCDSPLNLYSRCVPRPP